MKDEPKISWLNGFKLIKINKKESKNKKKKTNEM